MQDGPLSDEQQLSPRAELFIEVTLVSPGGPDLEEPTWNAVLGITLESVRLESLNPEDAITTP